MERCQYAVEGFCSLLVSGEAASFVPYPPLALATFTVAAKRGCARGRQRCCCSPPRHLGFPAPRRIPKIVGFPHRMSCCRGVRLFTSSPASTALQPQRQPRPALRSWHQSPASASSQMSGMDGVRGIAVRAIVRLRRVSVTGPPQHQRSSLQTIPSGRMPQRVPKACTSLRRILSLRRSSRRKRSVSI